MKKQTKWLVGILSPLGALFFSVPTALVLNSPAVGLGVNPVFSLSVCCDNYTYGGDVFLSTSGGTVLGQWSLNRNAPVVASMKSGLVVPAGEDFVLSAGRNINGVTLNYAISGQYVRS